MLQNLVEELRRGGTQDPQTLAQKLGVTPQMVDAMLEHLQRVGILQAYSSCQEPCNGCSLQTACQGRRAAAPRLLTFREQAKDDT